MYLEGHRHLYPSVAHHVDGMSRLGVMPPLLKFLLLGGANGLPRNRSEIPVIAQNLWVI